ncbi:MAG: hypothetical protein ABW005_10585, partial [Burkholderiaceae bacterium]
MPPSPSPPSQLPLLPQDQAALRDLMDELGEALMLLDEGLDLVRANPAAQPLLALAGGRGPLALPTVHGG